MDLLQQRKLDIIISKAKDGIMLWGKRTGKKPKFIYFGEEETLLIEENHCSFCSQKELKEIVKKKKSKTFNGLKIKQLPHNFEIDIDWKSEPKIIVSETEF